MRPTELIAECKTMALQLAPELAQSPLYFMEKPEEFPQVESCNAFATRQICIPLRDALIAAKEWHGVGPSIVLCPDALIERDIALGLTIHEIAHVLPHQAPSADVEPSKIEREVQLAKIHAWAKCPHPNKTMPRWFHDHGAEFSRICLHLHYRAWQAGFEVGLPEICFAGEWYDMSEPWKYMRALGDEPKRLANESFETITNLPFPAEFSALFTADFQKWVESQKESKAA